ncbi:MAG: helix-turn-helix domain-containing protein [Oscillospiraceae bacterium]|nr:helix-turn-helix domain-containing protein [Oscillospiraceae bacterium]
MTNYKDTPFMKIPDACRVTGLSQYYLRNGCKDGTIPHIKSGRVYFINVPKLLEQLGVAGQ